MAYNPRPTPRFDTRPKPDCSFYLQGYCKKGDACPFKHDPFRLATQRNVAPTEKVQEICKFFNSPSGCIRKDVCKYQHVKVPVEARINAPLGAVPQLLPASPGADDLHIQLDQHAAQASPPGPSDAARRHALGRGGVDDGQLQVTNGFVSRPSQRVVPRVLKVGATPGLSTGQPVRTWQGPAMPAEGSQLRKSAPPQPAPQQEGSAEEPVTKRLRRRDDDATKKKASVFERLAGMPMKKDSASAAADAADKPRRTTLASTVQLAKKRKVAAVGDDGDGDEEGELSRPVRTVRVAAPSTNTAQRQAGAGERHPVSNRLSSGDSTGGTSQARGSLKSRLGKATAGQAPLQAPSEAATDSVKVAMARPARAARVSAARALRQSELDAASPAAAPQAAAPNSTRLSSQLDSPLSDRPGRAMAKAPPAVKTLQELRMERERHKLQQQQQQQGEEQQKPEQQQAEAKRRRADAQASEVKPQDEKPAEPATSQRLRLARQPSADQQQDRRQAADPTPARRGTKAATPKASEHADDFDWEAGIAEDVAEADFGGDEAMEGDEQAIEEEEEVDVGEDTASAAVQQDDFARRMAAFADAFD